MIRQLVAALLMLMLSGAGVFAQPIGVEKPTVAQAPSAHDHTSSHRCCHSGSAPNFEIAKSLPPANLPCGSAHLCCVRPGPANFAEAPSVHGQQRPDADQGEILAAYCDGAANLSLIAALRSISLLPYGALSTVLRI